MGYYTRYKFGIVISKALNDDEFQQSMTFHEHVQMDMVQAWGQSLKTTLPNYSNGSYSSAEAITWYDHKDDIAYISRSYPKLFFYLEGDGEESPDFWKMYAHNGKTCNVKGRVEYEDPDWTLLTSD